MRFRTLYPLLLVAIGGNVVLFLYIANMATDNCPPQDISIRQFINNNRLPKHKNGAITSSLEQPAVLLSTPTSYSSTHHIVESTTVKDKIEDIVTIIIREYEDFDNDIPNIVRQIRNISQRIRIVIVCDLFPYPPLNVSLENLRFHRLKLSPEYSSSQRDSRNFITTEFSLLLADSTLVTSLSFIEKMVTEYRASENKFHFVAAKVGIHPFKCENVNFSIKKWTLEFSVDKEEHACDCVSDEHAFLLRTHHLLDIPYPFLRPFPGALFVQSSVRKWKVRLTGERLPQSRILFTNPHHQWKHKSLNNERWESVYKRLGIKKVIKADTSAHWYGCYKDTARCFGTVVNDMPDYLFQGRWTPPCCLRHLRETAKHVFSILEGDGVRYWLEGGSLLGAVRSNNVIPWDYDVDVGIYKEDVNKSDLLMAASEGPTDDSQGYIWERATKQEGEFYRVQYSDTNHLHVDIFPFYSKNGTMTKDYWFKTHRQDTEFPEMYLKPLERMEFGGIQVSVPNSAKEFLEFKFGKGVVENPKYPRPIVNL